MDEEPATFWVYILENPQGRFYIGHTDDLSRRLTEHNKSDRGRATFTHKNAPWIMVWSEEHSDRSSAITREKQIKSMKSAQWIRKELLNRQCPRASGREVQ